MCQGKYRVLLKRDKSFKVKRLLNNKIQKLKNTKLH